MSWMDSVERGGLRAEWSPMDDRWYGSPASLLPTFSGFPMDPDRAMRVSAVFACTTLIAETLGSLPCVLYRRTDDDGKEIADDHRLYNSLTYEPNEWMNPMDLFVGGSLNATLRGNGLYAIQDDGRTCHFLPLQPQFMQVEKLPSGRLRYRYKNPDTRIEEIYLQEEILHIRDISTDGVAGQARAMLARDAIAVAAAGEAFVGGFFRNDATGRLLLTATAPLNEEKRGEVRKMVQENYAGWQNRSKAMLLSHGVTATELGSHADSGFIIDPRKFQVADVCRFWRVPPFMIGHEEKITWGTNIEQIKSAFITFTIKPWADRWTQALERAVLTPEERKTMFLEFDFADLLRGSLLETVQALALERQAGFVNANEARKILNMNRREDAGGEEYQSTPTGGAPNTPVGSPKPPAAAPEPDDEEKPAAVARPSALLADAAGRISAAEVREVSKRVDKAKADGARFVAWAEKFYAEHRKGVVAKVLAPIAEDFGLEPAAAIVAGERIESSALGAFGAGVPVGWVEGRRAEVQAILEDTFYPAAAVRRAA